MKVPNPSGLCMCGCGEQTSVATQNDPKNGILKGQHRRYCRGHWHRGVRRSAETRARMSAANTGKGTGPRHARWNGGRQRRYGRVFHLVGKGHPLANAAGYAAEHRLVFSAALGRFLTSEEHVHHLDLNPGNNAIENLIIVSRATHRKLHALLERGMASEDATREALGIGVA